MDLPTNYHPCRLMAYLFIIPPSHPCKEKGDETLSYFYQCMGSRSLLSYLLRSAQLQQCISSFWGIMCVFWIYDLIVDYTPFELNHKHKKLAVLLCFLPLAYPLFSVAHGMDFPMMTSPVMPCSVAVFTIGLLLAFSQRVNLFLILFLCHWALIGFTKTYFFQIPEDFLLASSAVPGLYLFFKEYIAANLHTATHLKARLVNITLLVVCGAISLLFMISMVCELAQDGSLSK